MWNRLKGLFGGGKPVLVPGGAGIEEGTARSIDLGDPHAGGVRVILCKVEGEVHALDATCPHGEGGHIQTGPREEGTHAVCPLHRYLFDPRTGRARGDICKPARRFKVRVTGEDLEVFV